MLVFIAQFSYIMCVYHYFLSWAMIENTMHTLRLNWNFFYLGSWGPPGLCVHMHKINFNVSGSAFKLTWIKQSSKWGCPHYMQTLFLASKKHRISGILGIHCRKWVRDHQHKHLQALELFCQWMSQHLRGMATIRTSDFCLCIMLSTVKTVV